MKTSILYGNPIFYIKNKHESVVWLPERMNTNLYGGLSTMQNTNLSGGRGIGDAAPYSHCFRLVYNIRLFPGDTGDSGDRHFQLTAVFFTARYHRKSFCILPSAF